MSEAVAADADFLQAPFLNEILQQSSTTSSYQAAVPPCRLVDGIVAYNAVSNMKLAGEVVDNADTSIVHTYLIRDCSFLGVRSNGLPFHA